VRVGRRVGITICSSMAEEDTDESPHVALTETNDTMSRLVEPALDAARFVKAQPSAIDYAERITKYIPGEILAGYLAINGILASVTATQEDVRRWVYVVTFALCLVLTPIYFNMLAKNKQPRRLQMVLSTVAFVVWAYNLGGVFEILKIYVPWVGSILLIVFSLISGTLAPRPSDK
jgi:hypothetical protein